MSELGEVNPEIGERARFKELESRYLTLYNWAKDQEFAVVYRAEGDPSWNVDRSGGAAQLQGTWYTERFELIGGIKSNIETMSGMPAKVYSLVVPKSLLDSRDPMTKGMSEVNVLNQDLLAGKREISQPEDAGEPTLDIYLNQFDFVREYKNLQALSSPQEGLGANR